MDLIDIQNTTFNIRKVHMFSSSHATFSTEHIWGHQTIVTFKKIKSISSVFSDHNGMNVETNNKILQNSKICRLNNILLTAVNQGRNSKEKFKTSWGK
jgi:isopropylmalate/homocitrate/citramalate synthase